MRYEFLSQTMASFGDVVLMYTTWDIAFKVTNLRWIVKKCKENYLHTQRALGLSINLT